MYEVRFSFQRSQAQTARYDVRPEQVIEVATEAEALRLLSAPPRGARFGMARELTPLRFIKRRCYR
jgi:hypothetical protein